jgi:two-component system OmpR family sensor kinase
MRERVFDRFARADSVRTRRGGGVGLGLALSTAVVRAHRGALELVDGNGHGARFRVHLPIEPKPEDSQSDAKLGDRTDN